MQAMQQQENLPSVRNIINHDVMNCTADGVVGNHLYSGRALGISEPWDTIQLHPNLEPLWDDIQAHYKRVGLSHTQDVIWDLNLKHLGAHIGFQPSVFYFGPNECTYWGDQKWLEVVEYINSKNNFIALAEELGVDVPQTLCFDSVKDIDPALISDIVFPCYLKAAISVSGVGIYRCENEAAFISAMESFAEDIPVQVQEEVKTQIFLNLQYQVIGKELVRLCASEQILDGFAHQGNRVPTQFEPWDTVEPMAQWLLDNGMKGIFAFDVAIVQTNKGLRFPAIECNPRFNGASYPTLIAQKLGIDEWSAINLSVDAYTLAELSLKEFEYDPKTGEGVIIVNWGTCLVGKISVLIAGPPSYQQSVAIDLELKF